MFEVTTTVYCDKYFVLTCVHFVGSKFTHTGYAVDEITVQLSLRS
jgi:hypothetical protein